MNREQNSTALPFKPKTLEELREGWPTEIDHLSASSITQLLRCPEQFRQYRFLGKKQRPGGVQLAGRADSEALALHFGKQVEDGIGLTVEDVQDAYATAFNREVNEVGVSEIDWRGDPFKTRGKLLDNGAYLTGLYRKQVAPEVVPIASELKFQVHQPNWIVPIVGYLDVETETRIIERKSMGRTESKPKGDWIAQGHIYQLTMQKDLAWHLSVRNENKLKQAVYGEQAAFTLERNVQRDRMTDLMVTQAMETIKHLYTVYGPDNVWPGALTHPWACQYCGYSNNCSWRNT